MRVCGNGTCSETKTGGLGTHFQKNAITWHRMGQHTLQHAWNLQTNRNKSAVRTFAPGGRWRRVPCAGPSVGFRDRVETTAIWFWHVKSGASGHGRLDATCHDA